MNSNCPHWRLAIRAALQRLFNTAVLLLKLYTLQSLLSSERRIMPFLEEGEEWERWLVEAFSWLQQRFSWNPYLLLRSCKQIQHDRCSTHLVPYPSDAGVAVVIHCFASSYPIPAQYLYCYPKKLRIDNYTKFCSYIFILTNLAIRIISSLFSVTVVGTVQDNNLCVVLTATLFNPLNWKALR